MSRIKLNLSQSIPIQIDQGKNAATMTSVVISPTEELVVALNTANTDLSTKNADVLEARQGLQEAKAALEISAATQRVAFGNLGGFVQTKSGGDATYILSCGFGLRSSGGSNPPVEDPPTALKTKATARR